MIFSKSPQDTPQADEENQELVALVQKEVAIEVERIFKQLEQKDVNEKTDKALLSEDVPVLHASSGLGQTKELTVSPPRSELIKEKSRGALGAILSSFADDSNDDDDGVLYLDEDTFTIMMISPMEWSCTKCCFFLFVPCALFAKRSSWVFGLVPFFIQLLLCVIIICDQTGFDLIEWLSDTDKPFNVSLNVPFKRPTNFIAVYTIQFFTILLTLMTQTDVLSATQTFVLLYYGSWRQTISRGDDNQIEAGCLTWIARVLIPLSLKFSQGAFVLFISWLIIVQSTEAIELLKDFAALFIISSIDDIFYFVAVGGYFGSELQSSALEAKGVQIFIQNSNSTEGECNGKRKSARVLRILFLFLLLLMVGTWVWILIERERSEEDDMNRFIFKNETEASG